VLLLEHAAWNRSDSKSLGIDGTPAGSLRQRKVGRRCRTQDEDIANSPEALARPEVPPFAPEPAWVRADKASSRWARRLQTLRCMSNQRAVSRILQEYAKGYITCDEAQRRLERTGASDVSEAADRMKRLVLGFLGLAGHP
jgi:hypothetical protein